MAEKSTSPTCMHFRCVLIKDRCHLNMTPVHNKPEFPYYTVKACLLSGLSSIIWTPSFIMDKSHSQMTPIFILFHPFNKNTSGMYTYAGLCLRRAWWPLAPNFCCWVTEKSLLFNTNHMQGTLDFTGSEHILTCI